MNQGNHYDPLTNNTYSNEELESVSTLPVHMQLPSLAEGRKRTQEMNDSIYEANRKAFVAGSTSNNDNIGNTQSSGSIEPSKLGFFSYAVLTLVGGVVLLYLGVLALSSNLYADVVMPFASKQFVDGRIRLLGGFATSDEWKKSVGFKSSPQFER